MWFHSVYAQGIGVQGAGGTWYCARTIIVVQMKS